MKNPATKNATNCYFANFWLHKNICIVWFPNKMCNLFMIFGRKKSLPKNIGTDSLT